MDQAPRCVSGRRLRTTWRPMPVRYSPADALTWSLAWHCRQGAMDLRTWAPWTLPGSGIEVAASSERKGAVMVAAAAMPALDG